MEWFLAGMVVVAGGGAVWRSLGVRRARHRDAADELAGVQAMADEDVTLLGEQLSRLGVDNPVEAMGEATRVDYQTALDSYEAAKRAVPRLTSADEVSTVVDILGTGRYALACVRARLAGQPVPALRVPCFFNPQHGPSTRDVRWTAPGRGTRTVPACAQDAARVERGERPDIRTVRVGGTPTPYWDAGSAYLPYGRNYFNAAVMEAGYRQQRTNLGGGTGTGGL